MQCQVSLSIIAPRQLPLLRHVYNGVCVHSCLLFLMIDGLYFSFRQGSSGTKNVVLLFSIDFHWSFHVV
jgi:hypothetical protein